MFVGHYAASLALEEVREEGIAGVIVSGGPVRRYSGRGSVAQTRSFEAWREVQPQ